MCRINCDRDGGIREGLAARTRHGLRGRGPSWLVMYASAQLSCDMAVIGDPMQLQSARIAWIARRSKAGIVLVITPPPVSGSGLLR